MAKKLTQHEAWKFAEKLWGDAAKKGCDHVVVGSNETYGICITIAAMCEITITTEKVFHSMKKLMMKNRPTDAGLGYWWPMKAKYVKARAAFCRKMARLTKPKNGR